MKKLLSNTSLGLINYLMGNETIAKKVYAAGKGESSYVRYDVLKDGKVVLGETNYRFWNRLVNCQTTLPFVAFASAVWDGLLDLSSGPNNRAIEQGLSTEIATKAQREEDYDWVVERLVDCYRHVCNEKNDGQPSAEGHGKSGRNAIETCYVREQDPVNVNIHLEGHSKTLHFPDSTGSSSINVELGVVGFDIKK